jgi:hypothetical protein
MHSKPYLVVFVSAFGLIIIGSIIGNILESERVLTAENIGFDGIETITIFFSAAFV